MLRLALSRNAGRQNLGTVTSNVSCARGAQVMVRPLQNAMSATSQLQSRTLFTWLKQRQVKDLIKKIEGADGNAGAILDRVKDLSKLDSKVAQVIIERGWNSGKIPVNEPIMKEYLKAAGKEGMLDKVNITGLLAVLAKSSLGKPGATITEAEVASLLKNCTTTGGGAGVGAGIGGAGFFGGAGRTAAEPLFISP